MEVDKRLFQQNGRLKVRLELGLEIRHPKLSCPLSRLERGCLPGFDCFQKGSAVGQAARVSGVKLVLRLGDRIQGVLCRARGLACFAFQVSGKDHIEEDVMLIVGKELQLLPFHESQKGPQSFHPWHPNVTV